MENLATIVFERTPAGAVAIQTAGGAVPRQLRTSLLAIDGRSPRVTVRAVFDAIGTTFRRIRTT